MLGLTRSTVKLMPRTEVWHQLFAEQAAKVRDSIGEYALAIEHAGKAAFIEGGLEAARM